jgi:hypothetical protein
MDADFSVELGPAGEDAVLDFPWAAPGADAARYYDLKRQPELLLNIEEAMRYPEMGAFLADINSASSMLQTAKCDVWFSEEITEAEMIYGAACKQCSYVDLVFAEMAAEHRFSFFRHEELAGEIVNLLKRAPQISAAAEFIVRRCYYQAHPPAGKAEPREGFYLTFYLFGYGDEQDEARQRWQIGLKLVGNALLQLSARARRD